MCSVWTTGSKTSTPCLLSFSRYREKERERGRDSELSFLMHLCRMFFAVFHLSMYGRLRTASSWVVCNNCHLERKKYSCSWGLTCRSYPFDMRRNIVEGSGLIRTTWGSLPPKPWHWRSCFSPRSGIGHYSRNRTCVRHEEKDTELNLLYTYLRLCGIT